MKENACSFEIKRIRLEYGFTQQQFSDFLHIPKRTIENWEQGYSQCPDYVVELIRYRLEH